MGDLVLKGILNLTGTLNLVGRDGGKVKVEANEVLVEVSKGQAGAEHSTGGVPVLLPPPPAGPSDPGTNVWVFKSFNSTITAAGVNIVTQGISAQGNPNMATWPGMVQPSTMNPTITINQIPINVVGDMSLTLPNGGSAIFANSGQ